MYLDQENIPFYIGKGKDIRYYPSSHLRTGFLRNKINKVGKDNIKIHFLHKNLTEDEAIYWEKYWIKYIGRRDQNAGPLCNLTDGGEGVCGRIVSDECKRKISLKNTGKKPNLGRKHTEAAKEKMRMSKIGKHRSEETKEKLRIANIGKIPSIETREKISKSLVGNKRALGYKQNTETIQKRLVSRAGYKHSEETKEKMRKTAIARYASLKKKNI